MAFRCHLRQLDAAGRQHEKLFCGIAFVETELSRGDLLDMGERDDSREDVGADALEQRDVGELMGEIFGVSREPSHLTMRRRVSERVGFEPTCPLRDKTLSRRPRYDHFGTSPQVIGASNRTFNYIPRRSCGSPAS
jgi:hypothetical protein